MHFPGQPFADEEDDEPVKPVNRMEEKLREMEQSGRLPFAATDEELVKLVNDTLDMAVIHTTPPTDSITPQVTVAVRSMDGSLGYHIFAIAMGFNEAAEKQHAMRKIGLELAATKQVCAAASLLSEAWSSAPPPGVPSHLRCEPRHDPNRKEVLIVFASTPDRHGVGGKYEVTRDANNNIVLGQRLVGEPSDDRRSVSPLMEHLWNGYREGARRWAAAGMGKGGE